MSGDIVERLRVDCECYDGDTCVHAAAADEIVRLREERDNARAEARRLRAAGDALAKRLWHGGGDLADMIATVAAWEEARRG